jgi:hypothetical protein
MLLRHLASAPRRLPRPPAPTCGWPKARATWSHWTATPACPPARCASWCRLPRTRSTPRRSTARPGASPPATASCSRAWPRRYRRTTSARPSIPCLPASAGWTLTAAAPPTSTRTCSAWATSPARACCMSRPCTPCWTSRLPEGAILSHDLLEGSIARCGYAGDVVLMEDHPHHAGVAASRVHRWTRGDWQLLPLMLRPAAFGIDALGLWRMATTCAARWSRRPASRCWPGWSSPAPAAGHRPGLTFLAFLAGPLMGALAGLMPTRRGIAWLHFFDVGMRDVGRSLAQAAWQFSQLAVQAALMAGRRHARALAHGRQPPAPAAVDHRRPGAGLGALHAGHLCARPRRRIRRCAALAVAAAGAPIRWHRPRALPAVGAGAGGRLVGQQARPRPRRTAC